MLESEVLEWIKFACDTCEVPELAKKITVKFRAGMVRTLGNARYRRNLITLSKEYMGHNDFSSSEKIELVVHEACHLICHYIYKDNADSHGPKWKRLMVKCGLSPDRCYKGNVRIERKSVTKTITVVCLGCLEIKELKTNEYYEYKNSLPLCTDHGGDCTEELISLNGRKFPQLRKENQHVINEAKKRASVGDTKPQRHYVEVNYSDLY